MNTPSPVAVKIRRQNKIKNTLLNNGVALNHRGLSVIECVDSARVNHRLWPLLCVLLLTSLLPTHVYAHEVAPTFSNLLIDQKTVSVKLHLNIESFVARIDLESLSNIEDSDGNAEYTRLRSLPAAALEKAFRDYWPDMVSLFTINAPEPLDITLQEVAVPAVGNLQLPRRSTVSLVATLPPGSSAVTISWPAEYGLLIIRQQGVEHPFTGAITSGGVSELITVSGTADKPGWQTFVQYIPVGFDHIIPKGLDHILFVLGLFFLSVRFRPLVWQISVFTLAHTVTLALGALGWLSIPAAIVEPLIAASIVYVAIENIVTDKLQPSRTLVIFGFGLLHGLGFASVLGEFGLPGSGFIPALIGFNIGVELGQLAVVVVAFLAVGLWFRRHPRYRQWIAIPASILIALVGAWWCVERVFLG